MNLSYHKHATYSSRFRTSAVSHNLLRTDLGAGGWVFRVVKVIYFKVTILKRKILRSGSVNKNIGCHMKKGCC